MIGEPEDKCVRMYVCVCMHIVIVRCILFFCFFLAPCFIELLMFYCKMY